MAPSLALCCRCERIDVYTHTPRRGKMVSRVRIISSYRIGLGPAEDGRDSSCKCAYVPRSLQKLLSQCDTNALERRVHEDRVSTAAGVHCPQVLTHVFGPIWITYQKLGTDLCEMRADGLAQEKRSASPIHAHDKVRAAVRQVCRHVLQQCALLTRQPCLGAMKPNRRSVLPHAMDGHTWRVSISRQPY
jgi:hypothetical protein